MSNTKNQVRVLLFRHDADEPEFVTIRKGDREILRQLYELIGCKMIALMSIGPQLGFYYDDEGRLNENRNRPNKCVKPYLESAGYGPMHGNVVLVRETPSGKIGSVKESDLKSLKEILCDDIARRNNFINEFMSTPGSGCVFVSDPDEHNYGEIFTMD